jgi:O-6-methylguanine DNA methyltransferase
VDQTATGPDRIAAQLAADLDTGFAALFEAHQNVLFSTALRICGRWADAEDLTATIPRGETRPYGWIARQAGRPRAVRAAASALAANPVPLLIPCHRIVLADGVAGGYVFGTPRKEALLRLEGANLDEVRDLAAAGTRYLASDTTGVVCFPSCRNARRITAAHRHGFASLAAAGRAGFRPCLHCLPV